MKRLLLLFILFIGISTNIFADIIYDPVNNITYCKSTKQGIDQSEYLRLFIACAQIEVNIMSRNGNKKLPKNEILQQFSYYLKQVGTPTALQLIDDFKKNKIFYPDGSVMREIFV